MSANGTNIANNRKVNVKILEGEYSASLLENYLNNYVFTKDSSLNRIACKIDEITRKFRFLEIIEAILAEDNRKTHPLTACMGLI